jgi:enamine deaminase RidA (YjgF/YER057c/UK114 family)
MNALAQIKACVGSLERVTRIVRMEGYVHSAPGFELQPIVLNAASEILAEAFGEAGKHTRVALGINEMPLNAPVQIALWAEVSDE